MNRGEKLDALARLQKLREQQQWGEVASTMSRLAAKTTVRDQAAAEERSAYHRQSDLMAEPSLCLVRLSLANAGIEHATRAHLTAQGELERAAAADRGAREQLQKERARYDALADRARAVQRKLESKHEDRVLAELRSFRAAVTIQGIS